MRPCRPPCFPRCPSIVFLTVFAVATVLAAVPLVASELQDTAPRVRPLNAVGDPDSPVELQTDDRGVRAKGIRADEMSRQRERVRMDRFPALSEGPATTTGWLNLGLYGGSVASIAVSPTNPNVVLAGIDSYFSNGRSLYRSADGGVTWGALPFVTGGVSDLEFAPDGTAYAAADAGLFRGVADASSWVPLSPGRDYVTEVALNPLDPSEIWIGRAEISWSNERVLRSQDGGMTWTDLSPNTTQRCDGIAFDPRNTDIGVAVFGGWAGGGRAWRTADGGATWLLGSIGLPNNPMRDVVHDGTRFLLCGGQDFLNQFVGVYESTTNGATWSSLSRLTWPSRVVRDLEISGSTILAATTRGLFRSTNGGTTWSFGVGGTSSNSLNAAHFFPGDLNRIILGAEADGVLKSTDGGGQFTPSSTGIRALNVVSVASNPLDPNDIAAAFEGLNSGGVFTTRDGGATWYLELLPRTRYDALEYSQEGTLYAASRGPSTIGPEGVYRRNANGSWTHFGPNPPGNLFETDVWDIRVSHNDPNLIMIGGDDWSTDLPTIWRSTNGGASWAIVFEGTNRPNELNWVSDIEIVQDGTDQTMLASHTSIGAVAISNDGGVTWLEQQVMPSYVRGYGAAASYGDPRTIYIASFAGTYKTSDAGVTWMPLGPSSAHYDLICDLVDENILYGYGGSFRAGRSTNGGTTFGAFDTGLDGYSYEFAWITGACPTLLLATQTGVYMRTIDQTAPELSVELDAFQLWPPTRALQTVRATVNVNDNCDANPSFVLSSVVVEDEADASDNTTPDFVAEIGTPCVEFQLRAERSGAGTGRRYLLTYTATDAAGNNREITVVVVVPHDRSSKELIYTGSPGETARLKTELVSVQPNPFNPSTTVVFSTARPQLVTVDIVDVRGARVDRLVSRTFPAGTHRAAWDGRDSAGQPAASGVYFVRFMSEEKVQTLKALLIK